MPVRRVHVWISGHVHGVFFRATTQRQALAHGVHGWVCNLEDGRVEAVFEGEATAVSKLVAWCHNGPANAYVTDVAVLEEPPTGDYTSFAVRY